MLIKFDLIEEKNENNEIQKRTYLTLKDIHYLGFIPNDRDNIDDNETDYHEIDILEESSIKI